MTNKEAIDRLSIMQGRCENGYDEEALDLAIKALWDDMVEAQLDIKLLKMDLPELFRPSYDGGYLKEGEEE